MEFGEEEVGNNGQTLLKMPKMLETNVPKGKEKGH